jgi:hypothetical protein
MSLEKLSGLKKVEVSGTLYEKIICKIHLKKNEMAPLNLVMSSVLSLLLIMLVNFLAIFFVLNTEGQGDYFSITQFSIYND